MDIERGIQAMDGVYRSCKDSIGLLDTRTDSQSTLDTLVDLLCGVRSHPPAELEGVDFVGFSSQCDTFS